MHDPNFNKPKWSLLKELIKHHKQSLKNMKPMANGGTIPQREADRNPMGFMEANKNMSIRGRKGVAF